MSDGVVVMADGRPRVLQRARHRDDDLLRGLLDLRPDLLLGSAAAGDHRRLLLVSRAVPRSRTTSSGIASLERVYVDSDAVPLLVELHEAAHARAGDVLLRLLDRVALELPHCGGGRLRDLTRSTHGDRDEAELLVRTLGWRDDPDVFWARVESNLSRDRVRIVIVADRLPDDLARMVDFLDGQLRDVEIRAVEVALYGSGQVRALVPRSSKLGRPRQRARHAAAPLEVRAPGRHRLVD
jgi:hypothetical protein